MGGNSIDTTYSDLVLMVGGQLLFLFVLVMITVFGVKPLSDPLSAFYTTSSSSSSVPTPSNKQNK